MVTMGEEGGDVEFVPLATTTIEYVVPVVNTLLLTVLKVIVVLDSPEEVPVITEPPPEGVAVAVQDNAPVTDLKVTVVCVDEEEEALTPVGAARGGVTELDSLEDGEVAVKLLATTVNVYGISVDNPFTVIVVDDEVPVSPPGEDVAV